MIVALRVRADSGQTLPPGLTVGRAWIVHNAEAWIATPQQEQRGTGAELEVVARQGPRWPTGDSVFAAVEFRIAGAGPYRMRGPREPLRESRVVSHATRGLTNAEAAKGAIHLVRQAR